MNDAFYNRFNYINHSFVNHSFDSGSKFINGGSILIIHRYKLYICNIRADNADYMRLVKFSNDVLIYLTNHYARKM